MIPLDYFALRLLRRFMPAPIIRWAMKRQLGIQPGLETREPERAGDRYEAALQASGSKLHGKRILILGYGGYFGLGVNLLERGARHVVLVDPYAQENHKLNLTLLQNSSPYLSLVDGCATPIEEWITIINDPLHEHPFELGEPIDLVFSSSVLEHVSSPEVVVGDLARLTHPGGLHIHFVDLRDHFFRYPFEMLCHSDIVWTRFLNPTSNLNRLRIWDFEELFRRYFQSVGIEIIENEITNYFKVRRRIKPEFISGNDDVDSATRVLIRASLPMKGS